MVNATQGLPRTASGEIDVEGWHAGIVRQHPALEAEPVLDALRFVRALPIRAEDYLERGIELANLILTLRMDAESVAAALVYRPLRAGVVRLGDVEYSTSPAVGRLAESVLRMADTSLLEMSNTKMQTSESRDQLENVRRMLVSMIDDPRVAVLKLAERVVALRTAKQSPEERRIRIAQEALLIFAPLASRLGVWQIKWELEDLSLRYLVPDVYQALAKQLDGKRVEREAEVEAIAAGLEQRLRNRGIEATVHGRAKHLYSIWRKMRSKNLKLSEVYDVRAVRVLVPGIAECYSTLGVIHTEWQHIPSEFDDYIATPKENGYRSIHTAVRWDDGKTLEIQIRTPEMHQESELGVCAHWTYKGDTGEDRSYAEKMNWLRQVVDWQEETRERIRTEPIGLELSERIREERIFVYTPKGHVLDLTTGATPVDFAYRVHTEIGHRCVGAKVDGEIVALNTPLGSGERVEILTGESEGPRREWLEHHLEFVKTARAREKIESWFRARTDVENAAIGAALLHDAVERLGGPDLAEHRLEELANRLSFPDRSALLVALAVGDLQLKDVLLSIFEAERAPAQMTLLPEAAPPVIETHTIEVLAEDRSGLLLDITRFLALRQIPLVSNVGRVLPEGNVACITLEVRLSGLERLLGALDGLKQIPGVRTTRRIESKTTTTGASS